MSDAPSDGLWLRFTRELGGGRSNLHPRPSPGPRATAPADPCHSPSKRCPWAPPGADRGPRSPRTGNKLTPSTAPPDSGEGGDRQPHRFLTCYLEGSNPNGTAPRVAAHGGAQALQGP